MRNVSMTMAALAAVLLCGCTAEQLSRGLYEGARARNDSLRSTPHDNADGRSLSFDQYEKALQAVSARKTE